MLRRIARAYYRLRYFPRHLFTALRTISERVDSLAAAMADPSRADPPLEDLRLDMSSFCGDMTRALLSLDLTSTTVAQRCEQMARALRGLEKAAAPDQRAEPVHEISREVQRLATMQAQLDGLRDVVGQIAAALRTDAQPDVLAGIAATLDRLAAGGSTGHLDAVVATRLQAPVEALAGIASTLDRLAPMSGRLDELHGKIEAALAEGVGHTAALETRSAILEGLQPDFHRQIAMLDDVRRSVAQQAQLFPSWLWTPDSAVRVRSILALLAPQAVAGRGKVRVGRDHDGGYVMLDAFEETATALSLGIADDVSWDVAIAERGIRVLQFDPSVPAAPTPHRLFEFERLRVCPLDGQGCVSIPTILATRVPDEEAGVLLKIDIEGAEWDVFAALNEAQLGRFSQVICEFHTLDRLTEPAFGDRARAVLQVLARTHFVCHVHGNNCGNFANVANVVVPQSLEVTFASRARFTPSLSREVFPTPLDRPNERDRADLYLGQFRFDESVAPPP